MKSHALILIVAIGLSGASLGAHDMWIDPTTFSPASGQIVGVRLRVGQDLLGDPVLAIRADRSVRGRRCRRPQAARRPRRRRSRRLPPRRRARPARRRLPQQPEPVEMTAEKFNQ